MAIQFLNNLDVNSNQLLNAVIENQPNDTAAGTGVEGQLYYNTTVDLLRVWNGTAWADVGGYSGWTLAGDSGTSQVINTGNTANIIGGTAITTAASATDTLTITHSNVTRADTTSTASPAFGATFTAVDSVTSNAQGHVTALNLKTVTLPTPAADKYPTAFAWTDGTTAGPTGSLTGTASMPAVAYAAIPAAGVTSSGVVIVGAQTFSGNKTFGANVAVNGTFNVALGSTFGGTITVSNTGQSSFAGQVTIPLTPVANTDAASKNYVDQSNLGQSVFQGAYDAATNTPDLDVAPATTIKKGWFWAVTVGGTFFTEVVQPGDLIYANQDNPGATFANWTVVQSGSEVVSVSASTADNRLGMAISPTTGAVVVGLNVAGLTDLPALAYDISDYMLIYDNSAAANRRISIGALAGNINSFQTVKGTITAGSLSGTVNHILGINTIVQTMTAAGETVYCDVTRTATSVTATVSAAQATDITILVQKIGA